MKGTEKIIAHIAADAQKQVDAILAAAEEKCEAIRAGYEAEAKEKYAEKIRAGVRECEDSAESRDRIAQMETKKDILQLKQEMVSEAFALAEKKLVALPEEEYASLLASLAAKSSVTGDEEIVLNEKDRASIGALVTEKANALTSGRLTLADEPGDFDGGLILRRENIEVNCTMHLLVEMCRDSMSAELAKTLFE